MQDINIDELESVTGGAGVLDNMGTGASRLSNRWSTDAANSLGGRNTFFGGLAGAASWVAGGIVGLGQGFGHSLTNQIPLPPK